MKEDDCFAFRISVEPVSKKRPVFTRGRAIDIQGNVKKRYQWEMKKQLPPGFKPYTATIATYFQFIMPRPKNHIGTKSGIPYIKKTAVNLAPLGKKDFDNMVKFVCDCMNGIIWKDDHQVVESHVFVQYSNDPIKNEGSTFVKVRPVDAEQVKKLHSIILDLF